MKPSPTRRFPAQPRHHHLRRALLPALLASLFSATASAADLLTITRDALTNNAELASARAQSSSVEAGRDVERGDLLPQLNAQGNLTHTHQFESQTGTGGGASGLAGDDRFNSAGITLEATQALFDARNSREVARAEREIDQQLYRLAATEQQVLIDVATAYFDILRAHEILEARRAQERAIGRQLEQAREQFEVGLIAITEVQEAQASFDQARAERITAESNLQVSFEALERLTGQRYGEVDALGEAMPIAPPTPGDRDHWVTLAMENSPLVLASLAGVEVSRSAVEVARAGHLPTLNAFANYQYADSDRDNVSGHDSQAQVGLAVNLPLYTGGRTQAGVRQSSFQLEASQYDFEAQRRETVQRVRSLYTQVSNDVATVEARAQAIVSNRSALEATRAGYEVGTRNIVDVLNAERSLFDAIANHAEARYDYVLNLLSLRQQSGVLDLATLEELNGWLKDESVRLSLPEEGAYEGAMEIGERPRNE
ncbi:TolC family outer membrane protein [Halomonas pacifica]|uniref:TolC family outer membrane protein n=1 Tax=Bisbaumannia pacifica TaxID=77098 RepID=A0ABD4L1T2_9GAMM|nr:TolC family outer membrane protein [Halomonas pacifica]MBH8580047.1 TolC family outer membrane protein [Halomonas pacifica]MDC8802410.1 TolC family outer membrane protein [Halomonas pacifica]